MPPAHVVGLSWGGLLAIFATKLAPALLRNMVLIEPPAVLMRVTRARQRCIRQMFSLSAQFNVVSH